MSPILLYLVSAIYGIVACQYVWAGRMGMALAFGGYALANLGFVWDLHK